jgi:hypothetical protein
MRALLFFGWFVAAACARKHDGKLTVDTDLTTTSHKTTGPPGIAGNQLADAKPRLVVTASDPRLADGARAVLAASHAVQQGAVTADIQTYLATPPEPDGTVEVKINATAVFAQLPEIVAVTGRITGKVTYTNLDARELGGELGKKVIAWLEGEKLPAKLGLPSGPVAPAKQVAVAAATCSLHTDGTVRCWGRDALEVPMPSLTGTKSLEGANQFGACGVRADGHVFCIDAWDNSVAFAARNVCGIERAIAISVGQQTACALRDDGHIACWAKGATWYEPCDKAGAVEVTGIANAVALDVGPFRGCAVLRDGTVSCWEHCDKRCKSGVVGKVDVSPIGRPLAGAPKATQVAVQFGVFVVSGSHIAYIANESLDKPYQVTLPEPVTRVVRSSRTMLALGDRGHVYSFGPGAKPEPIAGLADIVWLDGDLNGACAVTAKGDVSCWSEDGFFPTATPAPVVMPY